MPVSGQAGDLGHALLVALAVQAAVILGCAVVGSILRIRWQAGRPAASSSPTVAEPSARRFLRICLGLLWILDGLLQAQPAMPSGFLPTMVSPALAGQPQWLTSLAGPLVRAWTHHPVGADAITVWLQIGLGVLILAGGTGRPARSALLASIGWSAVVWTVGEGFGGLLVPGASWLSGAPGAVLVYAAAAGLLLAPRSWWGVDGRAVVLARRAVGGAMLLGGLLQALPWETNWSADTLSGIFRDGATTPQPDFLSLPLTGLVSASTDHPTVTGALLLGVLAVVGAGLVLGWAPLAFIPAGLGVCALTWWLGQDFGVLGGTGTDPNSAVPLGVLLVTAWPGWSPATSEASTRADRSQRRSWTRVPTVAAGGAVWGGGLAAVLVVPLVLALGLVGPADAQAAVADDGGVRALDGRAAPDFTLADQNGRAVSLASLRGNLVLLTFLDPVCSDNCPVIANQLAAADRAAGARSAHVQIVAIDTNPLFHGRSDVLTFTQEHGMASLPNWHFVTGPLAQLGAALRSYGITVTVPDVGMVSHSQIVYFISPGGREVSAMDDSAVADLTTGYASLLASAIRAKAP